MDNVNFTSGGASGADITGTYYRAGKINMLLHLVLEIMLIKIILIRINGGVGTTAGE